MSYTFICTPEKNWYLKIDSIEQLLDYWNCVFTPKMKKALDLLMKRKNLDEIQFVMLIYCNH